MTEIKGQYIAGRDIILRTIGKMASQWSFWAGLLLILLILLLTLIYPCPTASQFLIFRIIIAMALGCFAASLSDFIGLKHDNTLKIGSGLIVFLLSYFLNPATVITDDSCNNTKILKGRVFLAGEAFPGVWVKVPHFNESDITNSSGQFDLPYAKGTMPQQLQLHLSYKSIDTILILESPLPTKPVEIYLEDTITPFTDQLVNELVKNHLHDRQKLIEAEHQKYLLKHKGQKVTLEEIIQPYKEYDALAHYKRNSVSFNNGFKKLSTQKALESAQIPIYPLLPYNAYYLENYEAVLYEHDSNIIDEGQHYSMHFGFLNLNSPTFQVQDVIPVSRQEYLVTVSHTENIRYVQTEVNFHNILKKIKATNGNSGSLRDKVKHVKQTESIKKQSINYLGSKPFEEYVIRYQNRQWQIIDTKT